MKPENILANVQTWIKIDKFIEHILMICYDKMECAGNYPIWNLWGNRSRHQRSAMSIQKDE